MPVLMVEIMMIMLGGNACFDGGDHDDDVGW